MHSKRRAKGRATRRVIVLALQVIELQQVLRRCRPRERTFGLRVGVDFAATDRH
jgi:hypothetical protein